MVPLPPLLPTRMLPTKNVVNKYVIGKSGKLQGRVVKESTLCGFNNKTHGLHSLVHSAKLKTKHPLVNQVK